MKQFLFFLCLAAGFAACNTKKDYEKVFKDPNIYCNAVHELNTVVMGNNFGPIVASRNYLYASVAGYEVIAGGYPDEYNSLAGQLHGAWLGLYGDLDKGIPADEVEALRAAAASADVPTEVVRYPAAGHGFHCHERPQVYVEPDALDAWARRAHAWADGADPPELPRIGAPRRAKTPRDVYIYFISAAKERNPAAAMALIERLR